MVVTKSCVFEKWELYFVFYFFKKWTLSTNEKLSPSMRGDRGRKSQNCERKHSNRLFWAPAGLGSINNRFWRIAQHIRTDIAKWGAFRYEHAGCRKRNKWKKEISLITERERSISSILNQLLLKKRHHATVAKLQNEATWLHSNGDIWRIVVIPKAMLRTIKHAMGPNSPASQHPTL